MQSTWCAVPEALHNLFEQNVIDCLPAGSKQAGWLSPYRSPVSRLPSVIRNPANAFRLRIAGLAVLLALAVAGSTTLAIISGRAASRTIGRLADVELESALLARQFRTAVDELHSALLRIGSDPAADSELVINQRRHQLTQWLADRAAVERNGQEHSVLQELAVELRSYYRKLDTVAARVERIFDAA